jgi:hypothetical protein
MNSIGLSKYCLDINELRADKLIDRVREIESNAAEVKELIRERAVVFRTELAEQYATIFRNALRCRV